MAAFQDELADSARSKNDALQAELGRSGVDEDGA
jgi:hypothetical protein